MDISVVIPTCRVGGIDVIAEGFSRDYQTFGGRYEVILVDGLYDKRKGEVKAYCYSKNVPLIHAPQLPNKQSVSIPHNNGLLLAEGEIVIHTVDYTFPKSTFLEDVANLYQDNPKCLLGAFRDIRILPYKQALYDYVDECNVSGKDYTEVPEELQVSIFTEQFDLNVDKYPIAEARETPDGFVRPDLTYLTPTAFPHAELLEMGGFDERLLGSGGYADCDVGMRFFRLGYKHLMSPKLHINLLRGNIPFPDPSRNRGQDDAFNMSIYQQHNKDSVIYVDNGYNIDKVREERLQLKEGWKCY